MMVEYLTKKRQMSFDQLLAAPLDASQVEAEMVVWLRAGRR
jgi:hypothetical protein